MNRIRLFVFSAAVASLLQWHPAVAQTTPLIKVLSTNALRPTLQELAENYQKDARVKVDIQGGTAGELLKRMQDGEAVDVVILTVPALNTLAEGKKVQANSVQPLVKIGVGIAVAKNSPVQSVTTTEQFKQLLLNAKKVAYTDPAAGGSSGIYIDGLLKKLGIFDAVHAKAILGKGEPNADHIVSGEADVAIQQLSELLPVKGVKVLPGFPDEIQNYTTYGVAISANTHDAAAAAAYVKSLSAAGAQKAMSAKGMQTVK